MKQHFIKQEHHTHLILFFAGWGMDENAFVSISPTKADFMICYDYRSLHFNPTLIEQYTDITLVGWSLGVWAASQVMRVYPHLPVTYSVAINGTPYPIDEHKGIAPAIFNGTLLGLNAKTLVKFRRRMCTSADDYRELLATIPQRSIEELIDELAAVQQQYGLLPPSSFAWQEAIIGTNDHIFLPQQQQQSWQDTPTIVRTVEAAHYQPQLFADLLTSPTRLVF